MDDLHAQSLQTQAIEALSHLRAWIWAQHATLLPDDVSLVTREQAERYSAYLEWYSIVQTAMEALQVAAPSFSEEPAAPPAPPTLRVTPAPRPLSRSGGWHRTIAVSAPASEEPCTRRSSTRHSDGRYSDGQQSAA